MNNAAPAEYPNEWLTASLTEISTLITNGFVGTATPFYTDDSGVPYLYGKNVRANRLNMKGIRYITHEFHQSQNKTALKIGDLLTVQSGHVGETAVVNKKFDDSNCHALIVTKLKKDKVQPDFLCYFLNSDIGKILLRKLEVGSTIIHINTKDFKKIVVPFPPLHEQQKIAKILTSVDEVIEKTQAQIDKLKDLKTGMMQELLTNGIGHTEFKDSPVGRIPAEWEVVKFKEIFSDYKYGPRFSSKDYHENGNVKTIRGTDLSKSGEISYQNVPIAKLGDDVVNSHGLHDGDLVMITTADCGATAIFREQSIPFIASAYAIKLTPKENVDSHFVTYFMQTSPAKKQVESFIRKGTVANLPGSDVMHIALALPPLEEQKKITTVLRQLDIEINIKQKKLAAIKNTKKALMQDLLTGKVRVKVDS
jgi:type I restriction enzyme S subunit